MTENEKVGTNYAQGRERNRNMACFTYRTNLACEGKKYMKRNTEHNAKGIARDEEITYIVGLKTVNAYKT